MSRLARGEYLDPQLIQIAHITTRCVRRAFLCGEDPLTGKCYEHRRQWIERRLEFLASVFAIDCLTFAVMSNHVHLILRTRPDIVRTWSDREIARRWLKACPPRKNGKVVENGTGTGYFLNPGTKKRSLQIQRSATALFGRGNAKRGQTTF